MVTKKKMPHVKFRINVSLACVPTAYQLPEVKEGLVKAKVPPKKQV